MTNNTNRRPTRRSMIAALKARTTQTFDSQGRCEHQTISCEYGRPHLLWSAADECIWCGDGREWR